MQSYIRPDNASRFRCKANSSKQMIYIKYWQEVDTEDDDDDNDTSDNNNANDEDRKNLTIAFQ